MRCAATSLLVIVPCLLGAQSTPKSLLWAINEPGAKDTSYLYGTIHSRDARAFRLQDSTLILFDRCNMVAGELELDETKKMDPTVTNAMFLPNGSALDKLYSKRDYREVIAMLKEKLGPLAPLCTKVRPFYTIAMLSEMELGNDSAQVLDAYFQERAIDRGQKVVGLETINEQLAAVEKIPLREQAKLLYKMVLIDTGSTNMNAAMAAYNAHDLDALMKVVDRDGLPEHADKALLHERNERMAERLDKHIQTKHRVFAAIGAAHLSGEKGVLELMRAKGYDVRPVGVKVDAATAEFQKGVRQRPARHGASAEEPAPIAQRRAMALKEGTSLYNDTLGYAVDMPKMPVKDQCVSADGSLHTTWVSGGPDVRPGVMVVTVEGDSIAVVDPRLRIEDLVHVLAASNAGPVVHARVQGFPSLDYSTTNAAGEIVRCVVVATPKRTHTFMITGSTDRNAAFAEKVIGSIRILE